MSDNEAPKRNARYWGNAYEAAVTRAAEEYQGRQAHIRHPVGSYEGGQRWWPDEERERRCCCVGLRAPSHSWPYSLRNHCRTLGHIAELFDVLPQDLRRRVKELAAQKQSA
ncbi:MAG: hypothetical protein ACYCT1_14455 [Steroidobacteraceae bacterium]|jgi:hypothetical protein